MEIGLSLGSNLGDRAAQLAEARRAISRLPKTRILAQSPIYETAPVGVKQEHQHLSFLNGVLILDTQLAVGDAQRQLAQIENQLGRRRDANRFAPRTMDIDILYAGNTFMDTENLTLPHPRWAERRFVVQPLCDVRPDLVLPGAQHTVRAVLAALPPGEDVKLFSREW